MDDLTQLMIEVGLSPSEAAVYLALISLGQSNVQQLSKKAGILRTSTYDILKTLQHKGLVSNLTKNKTLFFEATDPANLIQTLEERKARLEKFLPQMRKMRMSSQSLPAVEFFEGKEGIKSVYEDILQEKKELSAISNTHYVFNTLPMYVPRFVQRRKNAGIHIRLLNEKTPESIALMKKRDKQEMRETRFIQELKDIPLTQYFYNDKVAILSTDPNEPFGLIIRNKSFAKSQQILFDRLWKQAEQ